MNWRIGSISTLNLAALALFSALVLPCCDLNEGGDSDNESTTGWQDRGRGTGYNSSEEVWDEETGEWKWQYNVIYSNVILSPDGRFLFSMVPVPGPDKGWDKAGMVLVVKDLKTFSVMVLDQVMDISRINFSPSGERAYLLRESGDEVVVLEMDGLRAGESIKLGGIFGSVDVTPDGRYLLASNVPASDLEELLYDGDATCITGDGRDFCSISVVDLASGSRQVYSYAKRLRDLDYSSEYKELLVTYGHWDQAQDAHFTNLDFLNPATGLNVEHLEFPNCADELKVVESRGLALLSPTTCIKKSEQIAQDPISIIDLKERRFLTNLPGFGPVAVAADGSTAVGFTDREILETEWNYHDQTTPFGLIFVNLKTMSWAVKDYGNAMPEFTISPDSRYLLTTSRFKDEASNETIRRFQQVDLADRSMVSLARQDLSFPEYVWSPDGTTMFALSDKTLYSLVPGPEPMLKILATQQEEGLLKIRPQGDYLILGMLDSPRFRLVEPVTAGLVKAFDLTLN